MSVISALHLNFRGDARAALEYYQSVFGGEIVLVPYGDSLAGQDPEQIVWGQVQAPSGFLVMAYDVQHERPWSRGENEFFFALRGTDAGEITRYWEGLSAEASVEVPLGPSVFSPLYGKLTDRFGVTWIVDVIAAYED